MTNLLRKAVAEASKTGAVVYVYKTGECNVNAKGLESVLEASGHNVICVIDCTNVSEEAFDEDEVMFDANIDEILEKYEEELEKVEIEINYDGIIEHLQEMGKCKLTDGNIEEIQEELEKRGYRTEFDISQDYLILIKEGE